MPVLERPVLEQDPKGRAHVLAEQVQPPQQRRRVQPLQADLQLRALEVLVDQAHDPGQVERQPMNSSTEALARGTAKMEPMVARTPSTE